MKAHCRVALPILMLALFLAGCASTARIPDAIRKAPGGPVTVAEVQRAPERYKGQRVRWGGTIVGVENLKDKTRIEILSRPLSDSGRPDGEQPGQGRFLAELEGFHDPANYPEGRLLTVTGRITVVVKRSIGEYPYRYPVVAVEAQYLWPKPRRDRYPAYPYWYDPFYDPFYDPLFDPWYPYGYPYYW